jgi:predicted amidohydrolase
VRRAGVAAALGALVIAPAAAPAKRVRVFAVGPRFSLAWVDSVQHFHDKLFALADARRRGAGVPAVARGAGDVASHLRGGGRDLVAFPEDLGLMAAFTGSKGAPARQADSLVGAVVGLLGSYAPEMAYYTAKFPALADRPPPPTRALALALTDAFGRAAIETYAELAQRYGVWLEAGVNMARDWQVVCTSKAGFAPLPGGVGCDEENPGKVAQLRSPDEPARQYAYEATSDKASNMALVFDPSGRLVSKQVKRYLTPTELPGQLDLAPGDVMHGVSAVDTGVGRLGFVTSKDAWMPDVTERLDEEGVQILVQPEFFVNDTIRTSGPWAPDNIKGAGYSDVLRWPSMEALVLPQLTGNVFDFSADSQQAIVVKPRSPKGPRGALVGQPLAPGFAAVQPWVVRDPVRRGEPFGARRIRLGRAGLALLPSSRTTCADDRTVGPCRGGQPEGVVFHDVTIGQRAWRPRRPRGTERPLARARGVQRNVALAAAGRLVVAAFEQDGRVLVTRSTDRAAHWSKSSAPLTGARQWWPTVSVRGQEVWLAAQVDDHVVWARSADGGRTFDAQHPVDSPAETWRPSVAATDAGRAYLAWIDTRNRFTLEDLPQAALYGAQLPDGAPVRLDSTAPPADLARTLDNAWAPSVAAHERRVLISWIDFRTYDWDIYARQSLDGGAVFGQEKPVNDTPPAEEALEASPRSLADGANVAYTDWRKSGRSARRPSPLYDIRISSPGGTSRRVDGAGARSVNAFSPAIALAKDTPLVAWQDMARGVGEIWLARLGRPVRRLRVARSPGGNAWRPALAVSGSHAIVAWEDERDGPSQIYVKRQPLRFTTSRP